MNQFMEELLASQANSNPFAGPKSGENKRKVRLIPVKHAYSGQVCFIPEHEMEAYTGNFRSFRANYKPKGRTEEFMVQTLAQLSWSSEKLRSIAETLTTLFGTQSAPFETGDAGMTFNVAQAANFGRRHKEINVLYLYEQRKTRLFDETRRQLIKVQADRKRAEMEELTEAAPIRRACKASFQPGKTEWQPAEDGFTCSIEEIDRFIARADRLTSISAAQKMAS